MAQSCSTFHKVTPETIFILREQIEYLERFIKGEYRWTDTTFRAFEVATLKQEKGEPLDIYERILVKGEMNPASLSARKLMSLKATLKRIEEEQTSNERITEDPVFLKKFLEGVGED